MQLGFGRKTFALLVCAAVALSGAAATAGTASAAPGTGLEGHTVASPDGSLEATVTVLGGRLTYQVVRDHTTTVVAPSGLGFTLRQPAVDLTTGLSITSIERAKVDETWRPAWGTSSTVRNHAGELTVHTVHEPSGVRLDVVFRVFDDGVGFRYHFPSQDKLGARFVVAAESSEFALPPDMTAYYIAAGRDWNADEKHYQTVPLPQVPTAQTPITMSRADGLFVTVHEADLTDFPSMTLRRNASVPGGLVSDLIALPNEDRAVVDLGPNGFSTPWRTLTIGRSAGALAESHLIENLNDPCAICDVDSNRDRVDDTAEWIKPATYTGVWWELQRRATTWTAGPGHGATTARTKAYIDLAAEAGAKFVLAEGWNQNSGGQWANQDFLTPQSDFDLPGVLAYAASKGVGYIAHNETRGSVDYYEQNLEKIFSTYRSLGIHAIKTGYATKFLLGGVNRSHYDQEAVRHYQRVVETAARHEITVDAHEAIKPTGLSRTYPNMMTGEGVAGMEQQNYMGAQGNPPAQATILPFTRFIGGPADYTPGVLNVTWDPARLGTRVQSTVAAQLALYTTFYSPLTMLADTPENYALNPGAFEYLKGMPATWDESHVTSAVIGDHTVTARRSGSTWYVGAVTDENDRTLTTPLSFLDRGKTYVAEIYSDAASTTWKGNPLPVEVTRSLVTSRTTLVSSMVGGGGQAMRLSVASRQEQAHLPGYKAPSPKLAGQPRVTFEAGDRTVVVEVPLRNNGSAVGQAVVELDGRPAGPATRVDGGQKATVTLRLAADDVPYPGGTRLSVSDGVGGRSDSTGVRLLPVPTAGDQRVLRDLARGGELDDAAKAAATAHLDRAIDLAKRGDFLGTQKAVQDLRLLADSASTRDISNRASRALDDLTQPYLGEAGGVFSVLRALRELEGTHEVKPVVLKELRDAATAAAASAVTGAGQEARDKLAHLRDRVAGTTNPGRSLIALLAALDALSAEQRLEAESGTLAGGAAVSTEHPGFTGTGFVKALTRDGAGVTFLPVVPAGLYDLSLRYANGMIIAPLDRQLSLSVNNVSAGKVAFANTGQDAERWRRWTIAPAGAVPLRAGQNSVTLSWSGTDTGNVNVDHLVLRASLGVVG
jgi:hypothetical protein